MATAAHRIDWIDHAKGICIILVVLMHSGLGVEKAVGEISWLNGFQVWASPFRMPDFFLISGLLLSRRIDRPWRSYIDSKLVHFAYFYVLWMTIQFILKGNPDYTGEGVAGLLAGYGLGFVQPYGTLWFIYMLAIFFVVTKLLRNVPSLLVFLCATLLEMAPVATGALVIDEFAARYVYFFAGYWMAETVFSYARSIGAQWKLAVLAGLVLWGTANAVFVANGLHVLPGIGLLLGFAGAAAVIALSVLASRLPFMAPLAYAGQNSLVIYLAFFLFMASSRAVLLKTAPWLDLGIMSLIVTAIAVLGPLLLWRAVRSTRLSFLFRRPQWARLGGARTQTNLAPATARSA